MSSSPGTYVTGSMQGDAIKNAAETLLYFLKSLPVDCYFNVIGFGTSFDELFEGYKCICYLGLLPVHICNIV